MFWYLNIFIYDHLVPVICLVIVLRKLNNFKIIYIYFFTVNFLDNTTPLNSTVSLDSNYAIITIIVTTSTITHH